MKIEVESECGPITVSWPLASTTGASIGSLRQAIAHCDANLGDYLFVKATKPAITFVHLDESLLTSSATPLIRLALLLGSDKPADDDEAIRKISGVLGIANLSVNESRMTARRLLQARGETNLAELIGAPTLSVDDYIANMGELFSR